MLYSSITRFVASVLLVSASAVSAAPAPHAADDPDTIIFNGATYTITQATTVPLVTATAGAGLSYMNPASNGDGEQKGYRKGRLMPGYVVLLYLLPYSPNLNPIEEFFGAEDIY
ncbi:hypothetical protein DL767_004465 [Monosporascus sp. MG133]|nr:hypothetical protein DL767_004465 [Monosporascus sp. MG133]